MAWLAAPAFPLFSLAICGAVMVAALVFGASAERWMALAFALQLPVRPPLGVLLDSGAAFDHFMPEFFVQDSIALAACMAIALRANRIYPLWVAGAQLIVVTAHVLRLLTADIAPQAYAILVLVPWQLQALIILGGIACHAARERRLGPSPSWRRS